MNKEKIYLYILYVYKGTNSVVTEVNVKSVFFLWFRILRKKQTSVKENHTDKMKRQKVDMFQDYCLSLFTYRFDWVSTERANVFMVLNAASSHIRLPVNLPLDTIFPLARYKIKGNAHLNKLNAIRDGK